MSDQPPPPPPPPGNQWAPPPPGQGFGPSGTDAGVYYSPQMSQPQTNGIATASLVLGILSIVTFWTFGFGVVLGILAIVFGVMGRKRSREAVGTPNAGRATAGIVTGILGTIGGLLFVLMIVLIWPDVVDEIESQSQDGFCDTANPWDPDC